MQCCSELERYMMRQVVLEFSSRVKTLHTPIQVLRGVHMFWCNTTENAVWCRPKYKHTHTHKTSWVFVRRLRTKQFALIKLVHTHTHTYYKHACTLLIWRSWAFLLHMGDNRCRNEKLSMKPLGNTRHGNSMNALILIKGSYNNS